MLLLLSLIFLCLTKTLKTPVKVISLSDSRSPSSDMFFMCKHLSPCPLQSCTLLTSGYALVRKNIKKPPCGVCDLCFSTRRVGFFLFESCDIHRCVMVLVRIWCKLAYNQILDYSRTRHTVPNFQKGLFLFLLHGKHILCRGITYAVRTRYGLFQTFICIYGKVLLILQSQKDWVPIWLSW